jgi:4-hydroxy-tetrahydrodipicolinate reductase
VVTRVVVCYTGGVGSQVVRLLAADPAFEIAGVLVHHPDKDGRDAGELVGIEPLGLAATTDAAALVALRADCMLWHGMTWEPQLVARFLEAGTNVYSGIGGWYVPVEPEHELLAAACRAGGSTHVAGGNIPGLISDVLPLFVSGYSGRVRKIRAWQSDYVPHYPSAMQLELGLGIGAEPAPAAAGSAAPTPSQVDLLWLWGIRQSAHLVGAGLGVEVTDVRLTAKEFAVSPEDMQLSPSGLKVAKGTAAGVRWTFTAYTGDEPFFELVNEQTVRLGLGDGWRVSADEPNWRVEVVGTPTITATMNLQHDSDNDAVDPVSALNAARAVNFIPRVIEAAPGCRTVLDLVAPRAATLAFGAGK